MTKRLLSIFLCICLLMGNMPVYAADSSCHDGFTAVTNFSDIKASGGSFVLETDITATGSLDIKNSADVIICLNGHSITFEYKQFSSRTITVKDSGTTLTICDCSGNGGIVNPTSNPTLQISNNAEVTITGGNIQHTTKNIETIHVTSQGKLNVTGGNISNSLTDNAIKAENNSYLNLTGGSFSSIGAAINKADGDYAAALGKDMYFYAADGSIIDSSDAEKLAAVSDLTVGPRKAESAPINYTITFELNDGSGKTLTDTVSADGKLSSLTEPSRDGYRFKGWYTENNELTTIDTVFTASTVVYAAWEAISYTITYHLDAGSNDAGNPTSFTIEDIPIVLNAPERSGYIFNGWYDNEALSGDAVTVVDVNNIGDVELWAKWIENSKPAYLITFDVNGGMMLGSVSVSTADLKITEWPAKLTRAGYTFSGWFNDKTGGSRITDETEFHSDSTVYAHWTPIEYTISYNMNGGVNNNLNPDCYTIESEQITFAEPSREGYSFVGWFDQKSMSGNSITSIQAGTVGNIELWAKWSKNAPPVYTIQFNANGGTITGNTAASTSDFQLTVLPSAPIRIGYAFLGWYDAAIGGSIITTETEFKEHATIYAQWKLETYSITYHLNEGTNAEGTPLSYTVASEPLTLNAPSRQGYIFCGWFDNALFSGDPITVIEKDSVGNLDLWAKWIKCIKPSYIITFDANGGTLIGDNSAATAEYKLHVLPDPPVRTGYSFTGWFDSPIGGNKITCSTEFTSDCRIYAQWTAAIYTVTYHLNGGINNSSNPFFYTVESGYLLLSEPVRDGYTFVGWYLNKDFSGNIMTSITDGLTSNIELWAKWEKIPYIITLDANGGTLNTDSVLEAVNMKLAVMPEKPFRVGYTFIGWFDAPIGGCMISSETIFTSDTIIFAQWTAVEYVITYHLDGAVNSPDNPAFYTLESDTIVLDAPIREGYAFEGWYRNAEFTGETVSQIPQGSRGALTLWAKWTLNRPVLYRLTVIGGSGSGDYEAGEEVTISAEMHEPTLFKKWKVSSGNFTPEQINHAVLRFLMPAEDLTIEAIYEDTPVTVVSISVNSTDHKTLYSVGEPLDVGMLTIEVLKSDQSVETIPVIIDMIGGFDSLSDGERTLTITYEGKHTTLTVWIQDALYNLSVTNGHGAGSYHAGETVYVSADALLGYVFRYWMITVGSADGINLHNRNISFKMPASDVSLTAVYEQNGAFIMPVKTQLQVSCGAGGYVSPSGSMEIPVGASCIFTFTPMDGYEIENVYINGTPLGQISNYHYISSSAAADRIEVRFRKIEKTIVLPFTDVYEDDWYFDDVYFVYNKGIMKGVSESEFSPNAVASRAMLVTMLWRLEGQPISSEPPAFKDVVCSTWYADAISWAASEGIINGYGNGNFGVNDKASREQIMAILYRYALSKGLTEKIELFDTSNKKCSEWAEESVVWADMVGLTDEIRCDITDMTKSASRSEIAAFFASFKRIY